MATVKFEVPRLTVPSYLANRETDIHKEAAPGHKFLLYFTTSTITGSVECDDRDKDTKRYLEQISEEGNLGALEKYGINNRTDWDKLNTKKSKALKQTLSIPTTSSDQIKALRRRQQALVDLATIDAKLSLEAEAMSSLATGMGMEHPLENGFAFLNPYGLPYLPGSSIKGVLRRAAEELAFDADSQFDMLDVWFLFGFEGAAGSWWTLTSKEQRTLSEEQKQQRVESKQRFDTHLLALVNKPKLISFIKKVVPEGKEQNDFVATPQSFLQKLEGIRQKLSLGGALTFWDTIPELAGNTMGMDVMTPHYGDYYQAKKTDSKGQVIYPNGSTPHDAGSPNPIVFMVIPAKSKFTFHITADTQRLKDVQNWQALMQTAFDHAFKWLGFGAKTAVGYGAMRRDHEAETQALAELERLKEQESEIKRQQEEAALPAEDKKLRDIARLLTSDKEKNIKQAGNQTSNDLAIVLKEAQKWPKEYRVQLADLAEEIYNWHGWGPKKKIDDKKSVLTALRS